MTIEPLLIASLFVGISTVVGYGIVNELGGFYNKPRIWLLSPAAGVSAELLIGTLLNRAGLPVKLFGLPMVLTLLIPAIAYLIWRRPRTSPKALFAWVCATFAIILLLGWPSLTIGFDWVAFSNGDMLTYAIGATHFYEHGFYQLAPLDELLTRRNPIWENTFAYSIAEVRWGSQLMLAVLMSLSGRTAVEAFMPLILAFQLIMLFAAGALVCTTNSRQRLAWIVFLIVGCSSTLANGTFNQLVGQDFGLIALLASIAVLLDRPNPTFRVRQAALGAVFVAALLTAYPEIFPFLAVSIFTYIVLNLVQKRSDMSAQAIFVGICAALTLAFVNVTIVGALHLMFWSVGKGVVGMGGDISPYYLTPLGFGLLWGFLPYGLADLTTFGDQLTILAGVLLFITAIVVSARQAWKLNAGAIPSVIMLLIMLALGHAKSGFGLLKLAMYAQPFILSTLATSLSNSSEAYRATRRLPGVRNAVLARWSAGGLAVAIVLFVSRNTEVTLSYGAHSFGRGSRSELPGWTDNRSVSQLIKLQGSVKGPIISDAYDTLAAYYEELYAPPNPTFFFVNAYTPVDLKNDEIVGPPWSLLLGRNSFRAQTIREFQAYNRLFSGSRILIPLGKDQDQIFLDPRIQVAIAQPQKSFLLESANPTLFNQWRSPTQFPTTFRLRRYSDVHNFLIHVPSLRGGYDSITDSRMIWEYEPDAIIRNGAIEAVGRYLLFNVVNPNGPQRFEISFTTTIQGDGKNSIPPISVIGLKRVSLGAVGHGEAHLFSSPVEPLRVGNLYFLALDMGRDGKLFSSRRTGIMRAFGTQYNLDSRRVVGFVRDISLVSDVAHHAMPTPTRIANVSTDLRNPDLEFSGFYEDGWVADKAKIFLKAPSRRCSFGLRAEIPEQMDSLNAKVMVSVDGKPIYADYPSSGELSISVPLSGDGKRHEIEISSSASFHLPGGDGRPASMLIRSMGYE